MNIDEGPTQSAVRRQLAEDEAKDITEGQDFTLDDKVSPLVLIVTGMDLEAEQYVRYLSFDCYLIGYRRFLKSEAKKLWTHAQDRQKTKILLRSNGLQRKIDAWTKFQVLYCPGVERLRAKSINELNLQIELKPYEIPLWLPSQVKGQVPVSRNLQDFEWKLRYAQAHEALRSLRHQLQVRAYLFKFKDRFVRGQGANTRARNAISGVQGRIDAAGKEYRTAYEALESLSSILLQVHWRDELLPLMPEDIRDLSEGKEGESEGRRTISWIWRTVQSEGMGTTEYQLESTYQDLLALMSCFLNYYNRIAY